MADDELLTVPDCSRIADVSITTVRLWLDRGKLPFIATRRRIRLVRKSDLDALLASRTRHPRGFRVGARVLSLTPSGDAA